MKLSKLIVACGLLSCTATAYAESPISFSGNVTLTSDYVFRGFTQTDEGPAIQGNIDLNHESGFYLGAWASNVKFLEDSSVSPEDRADIELDYYLGYGNELPNGMTYDVGYVYYTYPGAGSDLNYDFSEFTLGLGYGYDNASVDFSYAYSPEFFGETGKAHYFNLALGYELAQGVSFSTWVGRQIFSDDGGTDYTDYGVSAGYNVMGVDLALSYTDTNLNEDSVKDVADGRVFFSISKDF